MNIYIYSHDIHTHTDIYDITYLNKRCNKTYYTSKRDLPTEQKRRTNTGSTQNMHSGAEGQAARPVRSILLFHRSIFRSLSLKKNLHSGAAGLAAHQLTSIVKRSVPVVNM